MSQDEMAMMEKRNDKLNTCELTNNEGHHHGLNFEFLRVAILITPFILVLSSVLPREEVGIFSSPSAHIGRSCGILQWSMWCGNLDWKLITGIYVVLALGYWAGGWIAFKNKGILVWITVEIFSLIASTVALYIYAGGRIGSLNAGWTLVDNGYSLSGYPLILVLVSIIEFVLLFITVKRGNKKLKNVPFGNG